MDSSGIGPGSPLFEPDGESEANVSRHRGRPPPRRVQKPGANRERGHSLNHRHTEAPMMSPAKRPKLDLDGSSGQDALMSLESALAASSNDLSFQIEQASQVNTPSTPRESSSFDQMLTDQPFTQDDLEYENTLRALEELDGDHEEPKRMTQEELYAMKDAVNKRIQEKLNKSTSKKKTKAVKGRRGVFANSDSEDEDEDRFKKIALDSFEEVSLNNSRRSMESVKSKTMAQNSSSPGSTLQIGSDRKKQNTPNILGKSSTADGQPSQSTPKPQSKAPTRVINSGQRLEALEVKLSTLGNTSKAPQLNTGNSTGHNSPYVTITPSGNEAEESKTSKNNAAGKIEGDRVAMNMLAQAESFRGLNESQINQLSKTGIAKWYEQKIRDMGRSFATYKKDMAPKLKEIDLKMEIEDLKRERDEQKKEREKAIGNEQQKFRNELTNKMSLIESLKKKLKTVQEKKEKEVVAYARCAEKLSQKVKSLTEELNKVKNDDTGQKSTESVQGFKEENARLQRKVSDLFEKAGSLQTQNTKLQSQIQVMKANASASQNNSKDTQVSKDLQKLELFKDKLLKQNIGLKDALTKAESQIKHMQGNKASQYGATMACEPCLNTMRDNVEKGKLFSVTSAEGDELFLTSIDQKARVSKFMASQELRVQGYLSTLKAKNDMISKLLEEVGKGRPHNPTTVCTNCLPWSKNYHNLCAKYENSQSKIAMLEIKAKSVSTNKVDKETNTVETGSTAQIGSNSSSAKDYLQDKNVQETMFNLNTKITRLQLDVTSLQKDLVEEQKKSKKFEEKNFTIQRSLHESQQITRELKASKAKLQHDLVLARSNSDESIKKLEAALTTKTEELKTATQSMVNLTLKHKEFEKAQAERRRGLLEEVDARQTAIDILVSKAKKKNEDFRRRMAWARTAMQNLHQEIYKLRGGIIPSTIENDSDKLSSELSKCRISADIQENKISELERLLRSNEVNLFKMQVEKGEVSAKLTKSFEDLDSIKAVSIRTIKTQVENTEKKWADVVNNKTKLINKLTLENQETRVKLSRELQEAKSKLGRELQETKTKLGKELTETKTKLGKELADTKSSLHDIQSSATTDQAKDEKIKALTAKLTNQQKQIAIQNQQINNQQQQINSLIMGSSQDFDDLPTTSSPPVGENKPTPTKSQLDLNTTDQKGSQSGLQVQRIPFTKSPVGSSQAAKRIVKTGGEAAVAASGSSSSSEELEVVYNSSSGNASDLGKPVSNSTQPAAHKLEVKRVEAPVNSSVTATNLNPAPNRLPQQYSQLTVVRGPAPRSSSGVVVQRNVAPSSGVRQPMKLQVTPVMASPAGASTNRQRPTVPQNLGQAIRVVSPANTTTSTNQQYSTQSQFNYQVNSATGHTYTVIPSSINGNKTQKVAVPAISAGQSAARSTTTTRPNTKGMVLTKVPVGPTSNAGQRRQSTGGGGSGGNVDGSMDIEVLDESSIIDGIPASDILKMTEDGDLLSLALASTGVVAAQNTSQNEGSSNDQSLLESLSF